MRGISLRGSFAGRYNILRHIDNHPKQWRRSASFWASNRTTKNMLSNTTTPISNGLDVPFYVISRENDFSKTVRSHLGIRLEYPKQVLSFGRRNLHTRSRNSERKNCTADLARLMLPSDANVAGNVHGGTIMKMMENAAGVAAARYFNQAEGSSLNVCALTSLVEEMTFRNPIYIGDVAKIHAKVIYASKHTVAVSVKVTAERMAWSAFNKRSTKAEEDTVCNRALVWLVGVVLPDTPTSVHIINPKMYARALAPPFPVPNHEQDPYAWQAYQWAEQSYQQRKSKFANGNSTDNSFGGDCFFLKDTHTTKADATISVAETTAEHTDDESYFTPDDSAVELVQVMLPEDCTTNTGLVGGGVVMKLMDNACGIVAARHCGTNIVTVSVNCVNLIAPVILGDILKVQARPTFTSSRSMEIEVSVIAERFIKNDNGRLTRQSIVTTERAYFTFVSLPFPNAHSSTSKSSMSSLPMPPLRLETSEHRHRFEEGRRRYERRKTLRASKAFDGSAESVA